MSWFLKDLPIVVCRSLVMDGDKTIYFDGVVDKRKVSEKVFVTPEGRKTIIIETDDYSQQIQKNEQWSAFRLFAHNFLNQEVYSRILYSIGKPTQKMIQERIEKSPVPFKKEWIEDIEEKCYITKLPTIIGDIEIYKTILPTEREMGKIVEIACKKDYWKQFHNRVPQKEVVYRSIFLPEHFNFKKWQSFLKLVKGGVSHFDDLEPEEAEARLNLWEIIGNDAVKYYNDSFLWHTSNTRNPLILVREGADKNKVVSKVKKGLEFLWKENNDYVPLLFLNFRNIYEKSWNNKDELLEIIENVVYPEVRVPQVANVCGFAKMGEDAFKMAEDFWLLCEERINKTAIGIPTIKGKHDGYTWEMLDPRNPRWLTVGVETNCCQHLGSVGGACVRYIGENPDSATTFVITKGRRVIAQSFTWISDEGDLVFDNIEILGDDVRDSIIECYLEYLEAAKGSLKSFGVHRAIVGGGYDDAGVDKFFDKIDKEDFVRIPHDLGYSDIKNSQYLVKSFE